ncbi:hypothetical protein [Segatella copri]|uniref:hypothetical protein n=1 Tax=Segatella copri TaxID=165179 RepID=UPI00293A6699|nr:hypothetical protein [Segatella copri]MDV3107453.1 hypothetical protein [Segatella copri]WOG33583.1 hypothetical protein RJT04_08200 [Segatella copri]
MESLQSDKFWQDDAFTSNNGTEVHSKIELQPLNKDGFKTIEVPEDNEANLAIIGILKYIIC